MINSYLKKIFSDLHSAIIGKIVSALLIRAGGIYLFSKKVACSRRDILSA
jgi:hypothetical protein